MDVTSDTVESDKLLSGETATKNDGTKITGSYSANLAPLTVKSINDEEQVFDGSPIILTEINKIVLKTNETSSGDSNTLTSSIVWAWDTSTVVIGNRYHLSGQFGSGSTAETAQRILFDTDWVASSNLTSIPFTTKPGYDDDEPSSFDGSIEFIEIKLSTTQMAITATAPFVVYSSSGYKMYISVSEIREACDGYTPVIVEPVKLISVDIDLPDNYINPSDYAREHLAIYKSATDITCTSASDWNSFSEPVLENCVIGNKYLIFFYIYDSSGRYVHAYSGLSDKSCKWDGTSFVVDLTNRDDEKLGTIIIENTRFKIDSYRVADGDIIRYFTISDYIDGFNYVTVSNASLTYGTFTITADSTTTAENIGYLSMCPFLANDTSYYPAYVATKVSGDSSSESAYLGRWVKNPSDGFMYVTFVGGNDSYTPRISSTRGSATQVTSKLASTMIENKSHFYHSMCVYRISDGAVLTASYINNN